MEVPVRAVSQAAKNSQRGPIVGKVCVVRKITPAQPSPASTNVATNRLNGSRLGFVGGGVIAWYYKPPNDFCHAAKPSFFHIFSLVILHFPFVIGFLCLSLISLPSLNPTART